MTRSDYLLLARAIRKTVDRIPKNQNEEEVRAAVAFAASNIADVLVDDNPRFDRSNFYRACGLEG